jgi:hypothetical protein
VNVYFYSCQGGYRGRLIRADQRGCARRSEEMAGLHLCQTRTGISANQKRGFILSNQKTVFPPFLEVHLDETSTEGSVFLYASNLYGLEKVFYVYVFDYYC